MLICPTCKKLFVNKQPYTRHINRKKKCVMRPDTKEIYTLEFKNINIYDILELLPDNIKIVKQKEPQRTPPQRVIQRTTQAVVKTLTKKRPEKKSFLDELKARVKERKQPRKAVVFDKKKKCNQETINGLEKLTFLQELKKRTESIRYD